jgi:hypothetical protein
VNNLLYSILLLRKGLTSDAIFIHETAAVLIFYYREGVGVINIREWLGLGYYTSELDSFLAEFDKTHQELSVSQAAEKNKYARVFALRDKPSHPPQAKEDLWENF